MSIQFLCDLSSIHLEQRPLQNHLSSILTITTTTALYSAKYFHGQIHYPLNENLDENIARHPLSTKMENDAHLCMHCLAYYTDL